MPGGYFGDLCELGSGELRVVLLDPRGTGGSGPPADGRYELEDYAADLERLREHLGLERLDLLGHSHGGFVGVVYAARHGEHLGRLVLCCSAPRFSAELREEAERAIEAHRGAPWFDDAMEAGEARRAGRYSSREELAELYGREARLWFGDDEAASAFLPAFARQRLDPAALAYFNERLAPSFDVRPLLAGIGVPTLILNGEADFFGPQASAREFAAIPDSTVTIMPGAGHFPFAEDPDGFRKAIEAWGRRVSWLPAGFEPPASVPLPGGHHMRPIRAADAPIDYPAVMGSRERLWAKYGEAWGWPSAEMSYEADAEDLARHEAEAGALEAFNYAVLDDAEAELLGCVYIDPPDSTSPPGIDAVVSWWVVDRAVGTELERALDALVPGWLADVWGFEAVHFHP
jgi:pimeloyl-ACP methyl ester carboxylesterase